MQTRTALALLLTAFWPVLIWYGRRVTDGSDEPFGVLALATALVCVPWRRLDQRVDARLLWALIGAMALNLLAGAYLPNLVQAVLLAVALGALLVGAGAPAGVIGLLVLSLPLIATMQFYLGYPLRVLTAIGSQGLIWLTGFEAFRDGVTLVYGGRQVVVDKPCAGIYLLWFGAFLSYAAAARLGLGYLRCLQLAAIGFVGVLLGNTVRAAVLFYSEAGIVHAPGWFHEGVGLALFAGLGFLFLASAKNYARVP